MILFDNSYKLIRTLFLILYTILSNIPEGWAQEKPTFKRSLWTGIRVGIEASQFSFVPSVTQSLHIAPTAGAMLRLDVERGASVQLEANWSQVGWVEKYEIPNLSYRRTLTNIEMPILAHLYLGKKLRFFLNAGPSLGYYIGEHDSASGDGQLTERQKIRRSLRVKNKLAWGLVGGIGSSLRIADRHRIELEARFTYGFGDIWGSRRSDPYGQSSPIKVSASINYLFRL